MKTRITLLLSLFFGLATVQFKAQGYGEIRGLITDSDFQPVPFATIKIMQGAQMVGGTTTDENGKYKYKPLNPGQYEILIQEPGHKTQQVNNIKIVPNEATYVDVKVQVNTLKDVIVIADAIEFKQSGVDVSIFNPINLTGEELTRSAGFTNGGSLQEVLEIVSTDIIEDKNGEVHFRGSRGDANAYIVDGVRTLEPNRIPGVAIDNMTVFTGGVPAMYGDISSGVVIVNTKSYFSGIRDKNIRNSALREAEASKKAKKEAKEREEERKKEIEEEKKS